MKIRKRREEACFRGSEAGLMRGERRRRKIAFL